jgi:hypothetical protein
MGLESIESAGRVFPMTGVEMLRRNRIQGKWIEKLSHKLCGAALSDVAKTDRPR